MTEKTHPIAVEPITIELAAVEPEADARPATRLSGVAGDSDPAARPPAADDEPTGSLPEDVGWPGRGEPCA